MVQLLVNFVDTVCVVVKVVRVDNAVSPPVYGVEMDNGLVRDTEYFRLGPRYHGEIYDQLVLVLVVLV